jgi:predicted HicB family RNase H-like nuclease
MAKQSPAAVRSVHLKVRIRPSERAAAMVAAQMECRPLSEFIRLAVEDRVNRTLQRAR